MVPMRMDVPTIEAGVLRLQAMCRAIAHRELKGDQFMINVFPDDIDNIDTMAFFARELTDECYVLDETPGPGQYQYYLSNAEHVSSLIRARHPMVEAIQSTYYASRLRCEIDTPDEQITLVTISDATWNVPRYCLVFVAMLKQHKNICAWAARARHRANGPGGAAVDATLARIGEHPWVSPKRKWGEDTSTIGKRAGRVAFEGSLEKSKKKLTLPRNDAPCVICGGGDDEGLVLLCDQCDNPHHAHCVGFEGTLQGDWLCPSCEDA